VVNMGLMDWLFKRTKKIPKEHPLKTLSVDELIDELNKRTPKINATPEQKSKLNLTKKIGLSFEKLDLNKREVLLKNLFLLDVSGSMDNIVDGKRKIDHLRSIMADYPDAKMICFSSEVFKGKNNMPMPIPEPNGSTDLAKALKTIKSEKMSSERIVLVSDGEPDDKALALNSAQQLNLPIDIIFIGEEKSDGEAFMEQLAKQTGGQHFTV